jgi:hypothetical protein
MKGRKVIVLAAFGVSSLIAAVWGYDRWNDRRRVVFVMSETPMFAGMGEGNCSGTKLALAETGTTLTVRRIRYKGCATLDVVLPDGRTGYVVADKQIRIVPPLP